MDIGSLFKDIAGIALQAAVTYFTGNPMLGQLAHQGLDSVLSESGNTGNSGFNQIFNANYGLS